MPCRQRRARQCVGVGSGVQRDRTGGLEPVPCVGNFGACPIRDAATQQRVRQQADAAWQAGSLRLTGATERHPPASTQPTLLSWVDSARVSCGGSREDMHTHGGAARRAVTNLAATEAACTGGVAAQHPESTQLVTPVTTMAREGTRSVTAVGTAEGPRAHRTRRVMEDSPVAAEERMHSQQTEAAAIHKQTSAPNIETEAVECGVESGESGGGHDGGRSGTAHGENVRGDEYRCGDGNKRRAGRKQQTVAKCTDSRGE